MKYCETSLWKAVELQRSLSSNSVYSQLVFATNMLEGLWPGTCIHLTNEKFTAFLKPTPNSSYRIITCATLNSGDVKFPIGCKKCRSNKKNACLSVHILLFILLMLSSAPLWIECMGMEVAKGRQCSTTRRSLRLHICSLLLHKHLSEDKKN